MTGTVIRVSPKKVFEERKDVTAKFHASSQDHAQLPVGIRIVECQGARTMNGSAVFMQRESDARAALRRGLRAGIRCQGGIECFASLVEPALRFERQGAPLKLVEG